MAEIYAGRGGGGSDWTASALLINTITSWTQYNSKKCGHTLAYDGAQLISAITGSRIPGSWVLTWFLTYSHIFVFSSHLTVIFTYLETYSSPLSSYIHSILLCYPPLMKCRFVWHCWHGCLRTCYVRSPTNTMTTWQHTPDAAKAAFFQSWAMI